MEVSKGRIQFGWLGSWKIGGLIGPTVAKMIPQGICIPASFNDRLITRD